jgi:hypothetical protein
MAQDTHSKKNKKKVTALAAILLLAVGAGGAATYVAGHPGGHSSDDRQPWDAKSWRNTGVPGDLDGNGKTSNGEAADLKTTKVAADLVVKSFAAANTRSAAVLVTPAGADWWKFVTNQAPSVGLGADARPEGVKWYAVTTGTAIKSADGGEPHWYEAIHVSFSSPDAADTWVHAAASDLTNAQVALRGSLVTLTPAYVNAFEQPFPSVDDKALAAIDVKEGYWSIDFAQETADRSQFAGDPIAYREFWTKIGFGHAKWTATSPRPDTYWTGAVDNFDSKGLNAHDAVAAVNISPFACQGIKYPKRTCTNPKIGASAAVNDLYVRDHTTTGSGEPLMAPKDAPKDTVLVFARNGGFEGTLGGTFDRTANRIKQVDLWVTEDDMMTIHPTYLE